jgi:hypothetical protein
VGAKVNRVERIGGEPVERNEIEGRKMNEREGSLSHLGPNVQFSLMGASA